MARYAHAEALFVFALRLATSSVLEPGMGGMPTCLMLDDNNFSIKSCQKLRQSYRIVLRRRDVALINRASANATAKLHNASTPRGRDPGGPPPLSDRDHPLRAPRLDAVVLYPQRHAPSTTPAPQPTLRADALFSLCRSPYPWLHPLLPLLALARVKGWRTVCDGDLQEGDEGSDSATPTPTPTPPRRFTSPSDLRRARSRPRPPRLVPPHRTRP